MRLCQWTLVLAVILSAACGSRPAATRHHGNVATSESLSLTAAQAAAVQADVRTFANIVAHDITEDGPSAWRRHFSDGPSFFMASEGAMAFPNSDSATAGLQNVARRIKHIELKWGDDLRVDPLTVDIAVMAASWREVQVDAAGKRVDEAGFFTGVVEHREGYWKFRDVHWSWPESGPGVRQPR